MKSQRFVFRNLFFLILLFFVLPVLGQESLPDIVERISPSVVVILTYNETGDEVAQGSGFFVNDKGDVVTNSHVIEDAGSFDVKTSDGELYPVISVLAEDKDSDLAVLAVDVPAGKVRSLSVNNVLPRTAENVIVIGCPLGLELTVSNGIVSAVRNVEGFGSIIQITAPISPGSSGGPVIDLKGNVIGVAKGSIVEGQNLNFAIPGERVNDLLASVVRTAPQRILSEPVPGSDAAESLYRAGFNLVRAKEYEKALAKFHQAVRIRPSFAIAFFYIGICSNELGRYDDALKAYENALKLHLNEAETWYNKGNVLMELGRHNEALQDYEKATQLKPIYSEAWNNTGYLLGLLGRDEEALNACEKAIHADSYNAEAWFNKGNALGNLGRMEEALQSFEQAIHLKPDHAIAWYNKGIALEELGRSTEARKAYERAKQINPDLE